MERANGYYWAKYNGKDWEVVEYRDGGWYACFIYQIYPTEIDERRIVRGDPNVIAELQERIDELENNQSFTDGL